MKISKQSRRDAKQLFSLAMVDGTLNEGRVRQTIQLLLAQKPRGYLAVAGQFQRLVKLEIARRTARVETAVELNAAEQAAITANLAARYGSGLDVGFVGNPALLGGLRIRVGSDVYDGSVQGRLAALEESF